MTSNIDGGKGSSKVKLKLAEEEKVERALVPVLHASNVEYQSRCNRRYLANLFETNLSYSDFPDCELVEGSSVEVQERCEKTFSSRRQRDFQNCDSDTKDDNGGKDDDDSSCFRTKCDIDFGWVEECRKCTLEYFKSRVDEESKNKDLSLSQNQIDHSLSCLPHDEKSEKWFLGDEEGKTNVQQEEDKDVVDNLQSYEETCVVIDREKLKETDEYKRAMEEEWALRKQAIQIQAEEAKNLRQLHKKRKAESLRSSDMERRQKERIEEVRNSLKKDEENMNLKERLRAEVRSELEKLEVSGHSMAWLLNSLGISVGSWPNPSPQEVQRAYKRALLTFHPDRASKSDIRQQVEAEEKFKLINRMKEKYT